MSPASEPSPPPVRAPFGPSLPELLRDRFGVPVRRTLVAVAAGVVLLALGVFAVLRLSADPQLVHEGGAVPFNLVYDDGVLHEAAPRDGELARLEGRRGRVRASIVVLPLALPAYDGNVARGLLPVFAEGHVARLRARLPGFRLRDEGRGNQHGSPGYQVGYASRGTTWRDTLVVPDEPAAPRRGVIARLRIEQRGRRLGPAGERFVAAVRKAYNTFALGTERA